MAFESIQRFINMLVEFKNAPNTSADEIDNLDKAQSIQSLEVINKYTNGEINKSTFKSQLAALVSSQDIRTQSRAQIESILKHVDSI